MANKSPSIILRELDKSAYAVTNSDTILCVVGYATKGPIATPTLVTSRTEFVEQFGPPSTTAPWGSLAVYRAFLQGNQVLFYRVAETTGDNQAIAAEFVILNDIAVSSGQHEFTPITSIAFGSYTASEVYDFKVTVDGGTTRDVYINSPASGDWPLVTIASDINTALTTATAGFQEYELGTVPTITVAQTEYRFIGSIDTTSLGAGEFSVFLDPGDTMAEIAAKMTVATATGTRGYGGYDEEASYTVSDVIPNAANGTYDVNLTIDGTGPTNVDVTITTATTWTQLAVLLETAVNNTFIGEEVTVRAYGAEGYLVIQSKLLGTSSTIVTAAGTSADLWALINGAPGVFVTPDDGVNTAASTAHTIVVDSDTGRIRVKSTESTGVSSVVALTSASDFTGTDLAVDLLTSIFAANSGEALVAATTAVNATTSRVRITAASTGVSSIVAITEGDGTDNAHFVALAATESAVNGVNAVGAETTDNVLFRASEKGTEGNNISVIKTSRTNPVSGSTEYDIEVYYNTTELKETFTNVSLDTDDDTFFATIINASTDNGGSAWVETDYEDNVVDTLITFPNGIYTLGSGDDAYQASDNFGDYDYRVGTDGIPTSGGSSLFVTALATTSELANTELRDFHILITPDNGAEVTQNAAITLAEYRKDFIYIVDPPYGLIYTEVIAWHNGTGGHGRASAINSSYASMYWPWLKEYNSVAAEYVWSPPSVFMAAKYIEIDRRFGAWYAVAGDTRGKILGASDIETSPSFAQRESLYGNLNAINPIVNFVAKGIEVYGQKTLLRATTALNRINVRRMVIYVKKLIQTAMEGIVFEPHNADSWARATNLINSILEPVRQANGLADYSVTINSSLNTADVIAQNIMKGTIQLVPVGTIEIIDLTIAILSPGATIT